MTLTPTRTGDHLADSGAADRLLVTRRDPTTGRYTALGFLIRDHNGAFAFAYLRAVAESAVRPIPGLPDARATHRSERLFPIFAERIMSSSSSSSTVCGT